jgi:hypothetical protein
LAWFTVRHLPSPTIGGEIASGSLAILAAIRAALHLR